MAIRPFRRSVAQPAERAMLRARRFIQVGQFGKAAALLSELAHQMDESVRPKAAAELHAHAAHCYVEAGIASAALAESVLALDAFGLAGLPARAAHFHQIVSRRMQTHGMQAGVDALRSRIEEQPAAPQPVTPKELRSLPASCPQCGAPLHGEELEWLDELSGECAYCGALIEAH